MKLTQHQVNHLNRLFIACENARDFDESCTRGERLDAYMEHLMAQGVSSKELCDTLYA